MLKSRQKDLEHIENEANESGVQSLPLGTQRNMHKAPTKTIPPVNTT